MPGFEYAPPPIPCPSEPVSPRSDLVSYEARGAAAGTDLEGRDVTD